MKRPVDVTYGDAALDRALAARLSDLPETGGELPGRRLDLFSELGELLVVRRALLELGELGRNLFESHGHLGGEESSRSRARRLCCHGSGGEDARDGEGDGEGSSKSHGCEV